MILITGATGYIAKNLIDEIKFLKLNYIPVSRSSSEKIYKKLEFSPRTDWYPYLKNVDVIIHLAGIAHKNSNYKNHKIYLDASIKLFKQASDANVRKIIFVSTVGVMGRGRDTVYSIHDKPKPNETYSKYKLKVEKKLEQICKAKNIDYTIIRSPLVYGNDSPGNLSRLISLLKLQLPIPLLGFKNKISLISITNLVDFIIYCINNKSSNNNIFFVSDGLNIQINDLIEKLIKIYNLQSKLFYVNTDILKIISYFLGLRNYFLRFNNPIQVDISQTIKVTGWKPKQKNNLCMGKVSSDFL
jgi:nucleoside-diphosphate-sugar epimerase